MNNIIEDLKSKLSVEITDKDISKFSSGTTEALVFSIKDKYLVKCTSKQELDVYNEFLTKYKSEYYQKIYYINYELSYVCLSYLKGNKFNDDVVFDNLINSIYDITSNYKTINYDGYGYLYEDHKSWSGFLKDEVDYSSNILADDSVSKDLVNKAIENISKYKIKPYLLHGDFGTHNFIVNEGKIYVIDPMGLVGDPLYDFYFAIFSDEYIFTKIDFDKLLTYFDRDINYKKSLIVITFFIRLCRAYKYDIDSYNTYVEYFNKLINLI